MLSRLINLLLDPYPHRTVTLGIVKRLGLGPYDWRVRVGAVERPHYAHCVYQSALLAKRLGYQEVSVVEFGVAGGNGLVNLESHAAKVSQLLGIGIQIYGFDSGAGLPDPIDYRDLPYHWKSGFFHMDLAKLRARLRSAKLVLGDIRDTAANFFREQKPAPIAAVLHDFDFYSSTSAALKMFDVDEKYRLPRIYCYFDDIIGGEVELYNDYTGERLAIDEFNGTHEDKKLSPAYHLLCGKLVAPWHHQIYVCHDFSHSKYNRFVSAEDQQRQLR